MVPSVLRGQESERQRTKDSHSTGVSQTTSGSQAVSTQYPRALRYLEEFIKWIDPTGTASWNAAAYGLSMDVRGERTEVRLGRELMDDFEVALERYQSTSYFETIRNRVRFPILIALGEKGLIPDFKVSAELLNERGEWLKSFGADVSFPPDVYGIFDHGLELLWRVTRIELNSRALAEDG